MRWNSLRATLVLLFTAAACGGATPTPADEPAREPAAAEPAPAEEATAPGAGAGSGSDEGDGSSTSHRRPPESVVAPDGLPPSENWTAPPDVPYVPPPPEEPLLDRVQFTWDLDASRGSPLWTLILPLVMDEGDEAGPCLTELLRQTHRMDGIVRLGPDNEMTGLLIGVRIDVQADVLGCLKKVVEEETPAETTVGGLAGYTWSTDEPQPPVLVEASPGWWLLGTRDEVDRAATLLQGPEADEGLAGLAAPLAARTLQAAAWPGSGWDETLAETRGDPAVGCLADSLAGTRGLAFGLGVGSTIDLEMLVQVKPGGNLAAAQQCAETLWNLAVVGLLAQVDGETLRQLAQQTGTRPVRVLQSARFEPQGEAVVGRLSVPSVLAEAFVRMAIE